MAIPAMVVAPRQRHANISRLVACGVAATLVLACAEAPSVEASSGARLATKSERSAILGAYKANDGNASQVRGVFVSRSNSGLSVVCARTPEAGTRSSVFNRSVHKWRYVVSGPVGKVGNATERALEWACG